MQLSHKVGIRHVVKATNQHANHGGNRQCEDEFWQGGFRHIEDSFMGGHAFLHWWLLLCLQGI